jgi:Raf kinase inhibitor-like YbhB/YbcL family protein
MSLVLSSQAFGKDERIPVKHTGDGEDRSPPLRWSGVPAATRELALICDDPDAPTPQPWVHWVLYSLAPDVAALPEGVPAGSRIEAPVSALQGRNSWSSGRTIGYRGPAPPPRHGVHHYHFRLYALDALLGLNPGVDVHALRDAMRGHILAEAEYIGTYSR